jgi:hypothetical protein
MLRAWVIAIMAGFTLIAVLAAFLSQMPRSWITVAWAGVLLLCLVFERTRYKAELTAPPGPDWVATNELDVDANGAVRVWYHPRTGERAYVRETTT